MHVAIRYVLTWTRQPPDDCGGDWTQADVKDVMANVDREVWAGYSWQDWYERLLESRLRRTLNSAFYPTDPTT